MEHQTPQQILQPTPRLTLHLIQRKIPLLTPPQTPQPILQPTLRLTQLQIQQIPHAETVSYKAVSYAMTVIL
jgi:hypothetical protein